MSRDEALKILNVEEVELKTEEGSAQANIDPEEVMKRFDLLLEKN